MSDELKLSQLNRKIHVGVILVNSVTELLDVAPIDMMSTMSSHVCSFPDSVFSAKEKAQALDIEFHWVNESGEPAQLTSGLRLLPTDTFETCPPLDLVIMGASAMDYTPTEAELNFVRKSYDDCRAFLAVCGGFQVPLQAGLSEGKTVTAPKPFLDELRENVKGSTWTTRRWQRDGKLWTTGTLLNGLEGMRALGEAHFGGKGSLMESLLEVGSWPDRDVNYGK